MHLNKMVYGPSSTNRLRGLFLCVSQCVIRIISYRHCIGLVGMLYQKNCIRGNECSSRGVIPILFAHLLLISESFYSCGRTIKHSDFGLVEEKGHTKPRGDTGHYDGSDLFVSIFRMIDNLFCRIMLIHRRCVGD